MVQAIFGEDSLGGRSETMGVEFMKKVGFNYDWSEREME